MNPPCTRWSPTLFDSIQYVDHVRARTICAVCPEVAACLERALSIAAEHPATCPYERGPDGTWAGLLWRNGSVVTMPYQIAEEAA